MIAIETSNISLYPSKWFLELNYINRVDELTQPPITEKARMDFLSLKETYDDVDIFICIILHRGPSYGYDLETGKIQ